MLSAGMDALAQLYKVQFDEALRLARQEDERTVLDILYRLRLKPDLGIYRRAMVNYALSINAPLAKDRMMYADECLDLIDILRKEKNITNDQDLEDMEEALLDIRDELRAMTVPAGGSSTTDAASGPAEPDSGAVDAETTGQSNSEDESETEHKAPRRDVFNPDNVVLRFTSNSKVATPNPNALFGQDFPKIESYLRDTWYPPRQETRPLPTTLPICPKQAISEGDTIDTPPASDPARPPLRQD